MRQMLRRAVGSWLHKNLAKGWRTWWERAMRRRGRIRGVMRRWGNALLPPFNTWMVKSRQWSRERRLLASGFKHYMTGTYGLAWNTWRALAASARYEQVLGLRCLKHWTQKEIKEAWNCLVYFHSQVPDRPTTQHLTWGEANGIPVPHPICWL